MTNIIEQMLSRYKVNNINDERNALKEVIQEVVLAGLAKAGFFNEAAFYGGTALRIFYGLDRFSEDLDFSLLKPDPDFDLSKYFSFLSNEINSLGLNFTVEEKKKSIETSKRSAFVKGNTREHLFKFYPASAEKVPYNELIKIKFEVDTNPPAGFSCDFKILLLPSPCKIRMYDISSLFAGKIHAILCRGWSRVKGRDLYDYLFYLTKHAEINMQNLKAKLVDSEFITDETFLDIEYIVELLDRKFRSIDYKQAKDDVRPFLKNPKSIAIWDADFFISVTHQYLLK
ncbi:MAG: nucleotidyl transferase AbiEii/AbiGii toxin family protein [Spirochaetes bacterium]|uniref:Nucleotidyl transferase AbiEii/AbiGii toxin family protein n=1 Tax=Candidatus Ornithospirochaeta stercoravium TaxID=2840897 RepID=A0A9D9NDC8_9SPIO|nr:nucleotidyl transferase AbiEii/AbiGii toxin family protein [Candidatus Ornithospirochaeta stercoravium]